MKNILLVLFILYFLPGAQSQQIDWKKTGDWKLYKLVDREAIKISPDSLSGLTSKELPTDSLYFYLKDAGFWNADKKPAWMGAYLLSYSSPAGKPGKLLASSYGGFLYDATSRRYLEIAEHKKADWLDFLAAFHQKFNEP